MKLHQSQLLDRSTSETNVYHKRPPRVGFVPVTMKLFWELYPELEERTMARLEAIKSRLAESLDVVATSLVGNREEGELAGVQLAGHPIDLLVVWANGYVSSDIPVQVIDHLPDTPILLLTTQRDASIPDGMDYARYMESTATTSMVELGGALSKAGIRYASVVGHDDDEVIYEKVQEEACAARVRSGLKTLNVGCVGYPYPGMLDIVVDEREVNWLGPKLTRLSLPEIENRFNQISDEQAESFLNTIPDLLNTAHVKHEDVVRATRVYCLLEELTRQHGFGALCIHDYECMSFATKAISDFGMALMENKHGVVSGVEGDIPNTISAYVLSHLTGSSSMFVDWTLFDEDRNALFFQHNGKADPSMVNEAILKPTAEPFGIIGDGAVFEVMGRPGPVTMLSMIHDKGRWKMFVGEGEALQTDPSPCRLNQFLVRVDLPVRDYLERVCDLGLTHHVNISHGYVMSQACKLARWLNIDCVTV